MKPRPNVFSSKLSSLMSALIGCCGLHYSGVAQEFQLLWSQPPDYLVLTNTPQMQGASRPSNIDWESLTNTTSPAPWNTVAADDFRGSGQPVAQVRWWGSYEPGYEPVSTNDLFEDAFVLSFFGGAGSSNQYRPGRLLAVYLAPVEAVQVTSTPYFDSDGRRIYQYEAALRDMLLDHGPSPLAIPYAFLTSTNGLYWLSVAGEAGLRLRPETNQSSLITNWVREYTGKRATNSFWGWQTAPEQHEGTSVSGGVAMVGSNWVFATEQWRTNEPFHGDLDQAFELAGGCPRKSPRIRSIFAECGLPLITVEFDSAVDLISGTDGFNYELKGTNSTGDEVFWYPYFISLGSGNDTAFLWFTSILNSGTYSLRTENVTDACGFIGSSQPESVFTIPCPPPQVQTPPILYLRVFFGQGLVLSWNNPEYRLEAKSTIQTNVPWAVLNVSPPLAVFGTTTQQFFRLVLPSP